VPPSTRRRRRQAPPSCKCGQSEAAQRHRNPHQQALPTCAACLEELAVRRGWASAAQRLPPGVPARRRGRLIWSYWATVRLRASIGRASRIVDAGEAVRATTLGWAQPTARRFPRLLLARQTYAATALQTGRRQDGAARWSYCTSVWAPLFECAAPTSPPKHRPIHFKQNPANCGPPRRADASQGPNPPARRLGQR
jgi:hypothetical protein